MRLLHRDFKFKFEFQENDKSILVIENPGTFASFVGELSGGDLIKESKLVLSENEVPVELEKFLCCIVNLWAVSLNEKRVLSKLFEQLKREILCSDFLLESNAILSSIEEYAVRVIQMSDFELTFSDKIDVLSILKFIDLRFEENAETLLNKIVDYMGVMHRLMGIKCFVFIHLRSYLTEYEIDKLFEYAQYQKIHILLIESRQPENIGWFSKAVIIDKDNCEILLSI